MNVPCSPWLCVWCDEELDLENCESVHDIVYCPDCGGVVGTEYTSLVVVQKAA